MAASYGKKNSTDLVESIKKRASIPISQNTFLPEDILSFANEEMDNVMIPTILRCKEEYYVITEEVEIRDADQVGKFARASIPYRAIGGRVRHIYLESPEESRRNLTRMQPEDVGELALGGYGGSKAAFFLEGDDIVLINPSGIGPNEKLKVSYYLRPNDLVVEDRVPSITQIVNTADTEEQLISFSNTPTTGSFVINYQALATGAISFSASATDVQNAIRAMSSSLAQVIVSGTFSAGFTVVFVGVSGDVPLLDTTNNSLNNLGNPTVITVAEVVRGGGIVDIYLTNLPDHFQIGETVDFIEDSSSHRILGFDIPVLDVNDNVGGTVRVTIPASLMPSEVTLGDHVAISGETKVPQIPSDMHGMLSQATACRILEAQGETGLLERAEKTLKVMLENALALIDNRSESTPQKILQHGGFIKRRRMLS